MFKSLWRHATTLRRLAWRSIWRQRRRTLITMASIGCGLSFAIFLIAMCEGVYQQVVNDALKMQAGHLTLEHPEYRQAPAPDLYIRGVAEFQKRLGSMSEVVWTKPLIIGQGMVKSGLGSAGVTLMGVAPGLERNLSPLARSLVKGRYLSERHGREVIIGSHLAEQMQVAPGKKLILVTNNDQGELVEELVRIVGVFRTGSEEMDTFLVQAPLPLVRHLFGIPPDGVTQLGIFLHRLEDQNRVAASLKDLLQGQPITLHPWEQVHPNLAAHLRMDRSVNWILQGLLLVIILLTILNTLLMSVLERQREFGVLLALGTPPEFLKAQVFLETVYLSLWGCLLGLVLGGGVAGAVQIWGWDVSFLMPKDTTFSGIAVNTTVYARVTPPLLMWTSGLVLAATLILSLITLRRLERIRIAEILRVN